MWSQSIYANVGCLIVENTQRRPRLRWATGHRRIIVIDIMMMLDGRSGNSRTSSAAIRGDYLEKSGRSSLVTRELICTAPYTPAGKPSGQLWGFICFDSIHILLFAYKNQINNFIVLNRGRRTIPNPHLHAYSTFIRFIS